MIILSASQRNLDCAPPAPLHPQASLHPGYAGYELRWLRTCHRVSPALKFVTHIDCEAVEVKNITVSVDDETYRHSRIKAAEAGTSVSALVRAFLMALAQEKVAEPEFDRLQRLQEETLAGIRARGAGLRAADNSTRDTSHERDTIR